MYNQSGTEFWCLETLTPFENEMLKKVKPAGKQMPQNPVEDPNNLPEIGLPDKNMQTKEVLRSQRHEAEREFELARAEEEEMSEINFKSTFFWDTL